MPRLFWTRSVSRVRRSLKVKTGQSTTLFHPATGNPIMTSTTYNRYADHATVESKTESLLESPGEMNDSNSRGRKGWVFKGVRALNDLLPFGIRPIKSKRAHRRRYLGIRHRIFMWRMLWRSHWKTQLKNKLKLK